MPSAPRQAIHPADPRRHRGMAVERLTLVQDLVEALVVGGVDRGRVLQEREREQVGGGERVAEQVRAPGEQALEEGEVLAQRGPVRLGAALVGDRVGRDLPDAVEPVGEDVDLGGARRVVGPQRRGGGGGVRGGAGGGGGGGPPPPRRGGGPERRAGGGGGGRP